MINVRAFWEEKNDGVILDNITIALSVLARRKLNEDDKGRMLAIGEQAMAISMALNK